MKKRMDKRIEKSHVRKRLFTAGLLVVFIVAVCIGSYHLLKKPEPISKPIAKQAPITELVADDIESKEIEKKVEKAKIEEVDKTETVAVAVAVPLPPERDLSLMIANAKTHVYTIYTDLAQGSGFLFNSKGDIVTNAHVLKGASFVTVKNSNGQEFNGQVIGISDTEDIALVRVTELVGKQPMEMEMSKITVGTDVFAIGSPADIANTSSEGKITKTDMSFFEEYNYNNLYEMNATIKSGSSGGPLIDANTERILGINSIKLNANPQIGYAIPIYTVIKQLNEWSVNPVAPENWEEEAVQHVKDAYLGEDLMRSFIADYYELIPYSLNDQKLTYYLNYLLPESQAVGEGKKLIEEYTEEHRVFDTVKPTILGVKIGENEADIEATAEVYLP